MNEWMNKQWIMHAWMHDLNNERMNVLIDKLINARFDKINIRMNDLINDFMYV